MRRVVQEWAHPPTLLLRLGVPFAAGIVDVEPSVVLQSTKRSRVVVSPPDGTGEPPLRRLIAPISDLTRMNILALSPVSAVRSMVFSALRHMSTRAVVLALCAVLGAVGMQRAAASADAFERRASWLVAEAVRLLLARVVAIVSSVAASSFGASVPAAAATLPERVARALVLPTVDAADIRAFTAEATAFSCGSVAAATFARVAVVSVAKAAVDFAFMRLGETLATAGMNAAPSPCDVYQRQSLLERWGICVRHYEWRLRALRWVAGDVLGATLGATAAAVLTRQLRSRVREPGAAMLMLLAGELLGAVLGRTVCHLLFGRFLLTGAELCDHEVTSLVATGHIVPPLSDEHRDALLTLLTQSAQQQQQPPRR